MTSHELFSYHSHMELERQKKPDLAPKTLTSVPGGGSLQKETVDGNSEGYIGVLEVYIHQARDIHNICIYHKQDVYAKLCLTSDPDISVSTQIINGGGKNPVFNQTLQLKVRTVKSSLKCEVWMLSRVKNYLEDQLLGFSLVPLSDILVRDGKLMREFSLSSTDLFHSPAGFLQLSLSYFGSSPEVLAIPAPPPSVTQDAILVDSEADNSLSSEYTKIEFPDPNLVNENQIMVSEYFGIPCSDMDSHSPESLLTSENNNGLDSGVGVHVEESFSHEVSKSDTPVSSLTNGFSDSLSVAVGASSQSLSDSQDQVLLSGKTKDVGEGEINSSSVLLSGKTKDVGEGEINSSSGSDNNTSAQPVINVKIETEQQVVQQDIVDMYMKSMQQFTESLAKMKLPMDIENGGTISANGNSSSDSKSQKKVTSSRVFYGSRAFF